MRPIVRATAGALVEVSMNASADQLPGLCDAALQFLSRQGLSAREQRELLHAVRVLLKEEGPLAVRLTTPNGESGSHRASLTSALEKTLARDIALEESASAHLLGGAQLLFGDERIDASLRGALNQLSAHLSS